LTGVEQFTVKDDQVAGAVLVIPAWALQFSLWRGESHFGLRKKGGDPSRGKRRPFCCDACGTNGRALTVPKYCSIVLA
jgi:hypothetical protein